LTPSQTQPWVDELGSTVDPSEDTVPARERWWDEQAEAWAREIRGISERTRRDYREMVVYAGRRLRTYGFEFSPANVTGRMIEALSRDEALAPTTRNGYMLRLRMFLRWAGNPVAEEAEGATWKAPRWVASHRDWATLEEIGTCIRSARDEYARLAICLMGTCGLREGEVTALRAGSLRPQPSGSWELVFRGKFDKPRRVALSAPAAEVLLPLSQGRGPLERVYPFARTRLWWDVELACIRGGIRHLRPHDLRRGFGREFLRANPSDPRALAALRDLYGHSDVAETVYYVALDREAADAGMAAFSEAFARLGAIKNVG
jgi:integrase